MPSILSRKRDLCYLIFFLLHLPILLGNYSNEPPLFALPI